MLAELIAIGGATEIISIGVTNPIVEEELVDKTGANTKSLLNIGLIKGIGEVKGGIFKLVAEFVEELIIPTGAGTKRSLLNMGFIGTTAGRKAIDEFELEFNA